MQITPHVVEHLSLVRTLLRHCRECIMVLNMHLWDGFHVCDAIKWMLWKQDRFMWPMSTQCMDPCKNATRWSVGLTLISDWISNYPLFQSVGEITYPFPNLNTVEVWEWISNFTSYFTGHMFHLSMLVLKLIILVAVDSKYVYLKLSALLNLCEGNPLATISLTKGQSPGALMFSCCKPQQVVEQTAELPVIWDTDTHVTSL